MSLNKFMHPRNKYRNQKPNFKELASKYPEFAQHTTTDESGKVHLDFKDPNALRALTKTLLKHDFQLEVDLPSDRLVPTIPLRLNYIHWIEDILGSKEANVKGIDIGTGSSCVYPLLGCRLSKWSFLATEIDAQNAHFAAKNVEKNKMEDMIKVKKVSKGDILLAAVKDLDESYDFCMCNPPFFADHLEAQAVTTSRSIDRADPFSVSTASPEESISVGGETNFISQMIDESVMLKERIKIFTSMVGKKSSLPQLKEKLRLTQGASFATTEFCQGKTMRWGIAWTYDNSVTFPKSLFHATRKEKPPLQYVIPLGAGCCLYETADLTQYIRNLLTELQIKYKEGKGDALCSSWFIIAKDKSWLNQRRKRRQLLRETDKQRNTDLSKNTLDSKTVQDDSKTNLNNNNNNSIKEEECDKNTDEKVTGKRKLDSVETNYQAKRMHLNTDNAELNTDKLECNKNEQSSTAQITYTADSQVVKSASDIVMITAKHKVESSEDTENQTKKLRLDNDDPKNKNNEEQNVYSTKAQKLPATLNDTNISSRLDNHGKQADSSASQTECKTGFETKAMELASTSDNIRISDSLKVDNHGNQTDLNANSSGKKPVTDIVGKCVPASSKTKVLPKVEEREDCVLKCYINLKKVDKDFVLELVWVDGESREVMFQLMQYFKNKLKAP